MRLTERTYRVNEIFQSIQGEGFYTGKASVFLRFSGCNRSCPFCDTEHGQYEEMTADEIVSALLEFSARHLVVTVGEPLLQLDEFLISRLKTAGFYVAVETNGSCCIPRGVDWVTCSPKQKPWLLRQCDELKVVFEGEEKVNEAESFFDCKHKFVQPLYDINTGKTNVNRTIEFVLKNPQWRLSLQMHRLLGIR